MDSRDYIASNMAGSFQIFLELGGKKGSLFNWLSEWNPWLVASIIASYLFYTENPRKVTKTSQRYYCMGKNNIYLNAGVWILSQER